MLAELFVTGDRELHTSRINYRILWWRRTDRLQDDLRGNSRWTIHSIYNRSFRVFQLLKKPFLE